MSTYLLLLSPLFLQEALPTCPPFTPWNPPSFSVKLTLSPLYALNRTLLFVAKVQLSPILQFVIWMPGCPFSFQQRWLQHTCNCSLCGIEATISYLTGPVCLSFLLKPVPFCKLFAGRSSTNQTAASLPFSHTPALSLLGFLLPVLPSISHFLTYLAETMLFFLLFYYQATMGFGHSFLPDNDTVYKLARQGVLLQPSTVPCNLFFIHSFLVLRVYLSHQNCLTSRFPLYTPKKLCSLLTLVCPLSSLLQQTEPSVEFFSF